MDRFPRSRDFTVCAAVVLSKLCFTLGWVQELEQVTTWARRGSYVGVGVYYIKKDFKKHGLKMEFDFILGKNIRKLT